MKFVKPAISPSGSTGCKISGHMHAFRQELRDWLWEILGMLSLLVKGFHRCLLYGPGYRLYYILHEQSVIILLAGGDKRTQPKDIKAALHVVKNL